MAEQQLELSGIVSRLERLEKEKRRLKRTGVVLLLVAVAFVFMGQAQLSKTVEAEKFELRDASGKVRAMLTAADGNAELILYGPQGSKQPGFMMAIGVGPNGPFASLADKNNNNRRHASPRGRRAPNNASTDTRTSTRQNSAILSAQAVSA